MALESDTSSPQAVIRALYEGISRRPGECPDWQRLQPLFINGARIIPPGAEGNPPPTWTFEQFAERVSRNVRQLVTKGIEQGFYERERANRTDIFGSIAHVWSTYESRRGPNDVQPFSRGINSFQLVRSNGRWWVVTIFWDAERPENPIPAKYLG
jgi:hypothetical protein